MAKIKTLLQRIIAETKQVLLSPVGYFSVTPETAGAEYPIIKVAVYALAIMLCQAAAKVIAGTPWFGLQGFITFPLIAVVGLYVGAAVIHFISLICGGKNDFRLSLRIAASLGVISVIQSLLSVPLPAGSFLSSLVWLLASFYGLWLFYNALVHSLSVPQIKATWVSGAFAGILILIGISVFATQLFFKGLPKMTDVTQEQEWNMGMVADKLKRDGYGESEINEYLKIAKELGAARLANDNQKAEELRAKMEAVLIRHYQQEAQ